MNPMIVCAMIAVITCLSASEEPKPVPAKDLVHIMALEHDPAFGCKYKCPCLTNNYAYYINWWDGPDHPVHDIYVFEKKPPRIAALDSIDALLAWAEKLPEGADVDRISTCGNTTMGLPIEKLKQLEQIFSKRKVHLTDHDDGNATICVCESKSRKMFKNIDEARQWITEHPDAYYYNGVSKITPVH